MGCQKRAGPAFLVQPSVFYVLHCDISWMPGVLAGLATGYLS
jgi:hypothetical protein